MNVFSYIRVSGKGQIEREGPDRQRNVIAAFCSRHDLYCAGEFFDAGVTGTVDTLERPQLMALIEGILKRRAMAAECLPQDHPHNLLIDAVVVEKTDRLARMLAVQESIVIQLRKHGIKLFLAEQGTLIDYASDSGDPSLNAFRQMMGVMAEFERANMCARMSQARLAIWKRVGRCEGQKPYGMRDGEADIMAFIQQEHAKGVFPAIISFGLNENNFKTRNGKAWTSQHVRNILRPNKRRTRHHESSTD